MLPVNGALPRHARSAPQDLSKARWQRCYVVSGTVFVSAILATLVTFGVLNFLLSGVTLPPVSSQTGLLQTLQQPEFVTQGAAGKNDPDAATDAAAPTSIVEQPADVVSAPAVARAPPREFSHPFDDLQGLYTIPAQDESPRCKTSQICDGDHSCGPDKLGCVTAAGERKAAVRKAIAWAWEGYRKHAWGHDEVDILSKSPHAWFGLGLTIVDSLDTLLLAGLMDEYHQARHWVANHLVFHDGSNVQFFEVNIRILGGLVSAYYLSGGDDLYLHKAEMLADRLMVAFNTSSGVPGSHVPLTKDAAARAGVGMADGQTNMAEAGTISMEFTSIGRLLGRDDLFDAGMQFWYVLMSSRNYSGLYCMGINTGRGDCYNPLMTIGSAADSTYEYMLKQWVMSNHTQEVPLELYKSSMRGVRKYLVRHIWDGHADASIVSEARADQNSGVIFDTNNRFEHLTCFAGGMFVLGALHGVNTEVDENDFHDVILGARIGKACYEMYHGTVSGLAPDSVTFRQANGQNLPNRDDDTVRPPGTVKRRSDHKSAKKAKTGTLRAAPKDLPAQDGKAQAPAQPNAHAPQSDAAAAKVAKETKPDAAAAETKGAGATKAPGKEAANKEAPAAEQLVHDIAQQPGQTQPPAAEHAEGGKAAPEGKGETTGKPQPQAATTEKPATQARHLLGGQEAEQEPEQAAEELGHKGRSLMQADEESSDSQQPQQQQLVQQQQQQLQQQQQQQQQHQGGSFVQLHPRYSLPVHGQVVQGQQLSEQLPGSVLAAVQHAPTLALQAQQEQQAVAVPEVPSDAEVLLRLPHRQMRQTLLEEEAAGLLHHPARRMHADAAAAAGGAANPQAAVQQQQQQSQQQPGGANEGGDASSAAAVAQHRLQQRLQAMRVQQVQAIQQQQQQPGQQSGQQQLTPQQLLQQQHAERQAMQQQQQQHQQQQQVAQQGAGAAPGSQSTAPGQSNSSAAVSPPAAQSPPPPSPPSPPPPNPPPPPPPAGPVVAVSQQLTSQDFLRPETIETLFYLWRATGDEVYREWGWNMFRAFERWTRLDSGGYATLSNVNSAPPGLANKMESFWIAETLKYFYLLFEDDPSVLPLDQWVFNTEAHPMPVWGTPADKEAMSRLKQRRHAAKLERKRHEAEEAAVAELQDIKRQGAALAQRGPQMGKPKDREGYGLGGVDMF